MWQLVCRRDSCFPVTLSILRHFSDTLRDQNRRRGLFGTVEHSLVVLLQCLLDTGLAVCCDT